MRIRVDLEGFKKNCWHKNLKGFFRFRCIELSDAEVRKIVEYGISKGYKYDVDIPEDEVADILKRA